MISRADDEMPVTPSSDPAREARLLLRQARVGALATLRDGFPFVSLVTPATAPDLSVVFLLSSLAEHRRNLEVDRRSSLMVTGTATGPNPQTAPRLTLTGHSAAITGEAAEALKARWLAAHPYAALYADFADFALFRLVPKEAHYVGGFARAHHLPLDRLLPAAEAVAAIAAAEARIIGHCNADHAESLSAIAQARGGAKADWRMAAVDVDGFDLRSGDHVLRLPFTKAAVSSADVRAELVRMVNEAAAA